MAGWTLISRAPAISRERVSLNWPCEAGFSTATRRRRSGLVHPPKKIEASNAKLE